MKRPVAFFDLETTGLNPSHDRIVEMSVLKINVNGDEEQRVWLLNPEMPISAESTSVHGYTNEMVADKPTFREKAKEIALFIGNADLAGYNILKFDLPMLVEEFLRVDYDFDLKDRDFIDVMNIYMKMEPRNLKSAYRYFCHAELEGAHGAMADTKATYDVLRAMLDKYQGVDYEDGKGNKSQGSFPNSRRTIGMPTFRARLSLTRKAKRYLCSANTRARGWKMCSASSRLIMHGL